MTRFLTLAATATLAIASSAAMAGLNAGPAAEGAISPLAVPGKARVYTAVINSTGALVRGTAGASSALVTAPASYEVFFLDKFAAPVNLTNCTYTATLGTISTGTAAPGVATTASRATAANGVFVQTFDMTGALAARSFHLVVACP